MVRRLTVLLVLSSFCSLLTSQETKKPLTYYLPDIKYDASIPTPESYLGFQVGEWHVSHDQMVGYFTALDAASDRIELIRYGKTHENRPLLMAVISSPENLRNKENIKASHAALSRAATASDTDISTLPAILWQGYTIHGNEASGNNAALLVAYYLAAGQSDEVRATLSNTVVLMDPCQNPDGVQRFSTWVNSHKSETLVSDPASREFSEAWPGGRYNHYWFDMNRDWLLLVHPESKGRIALMHEWHPNVLTDHHEMGTQSTFFFHPGAPASNNPNTPDENFILTEELGKFHARALDSIGSLYYTKYNFDDFYYGKGSTYPDAIGAIGILFEQASSRGHLQESINGLVSFPFTIRNQVNVSLSTQRGVVALRKKILQFKKTFHKTLLDRAKSSSVKGYLFTSDDVSRTHSFIDLLLQHKVDVYATDTDISLNGTTYPAGRSFVVPIAQTQPILAKTIFEKVTTFQDSAFYDVSGWTLPLAYGLMYESMTDVNVSEKNRVQSVPISAGRVGGRNDSVYAYLVSAEQSDLYAGIYPLQKKGIRVRCSQSDIALTDKGNTNNYRKGTLIIPVAGQSLSPAELAQEMDLIAKSSHLQIDAISTGNSTALVTLGHPLVQPLITPSVISFAGSGIQPQSAGEIWHHFDKQLGLPLTQIEPTRLKQTSLTRYTTMILPDGSYSSWSDTETTKLKEWLQQGNTLIAIGSACQWLSSKSLITINYKKQEKKPAGSGQYEQAEKEADGRVLAGSIFAVDADLSHPILYGLSNSRLAVMKTSNRVAELTANAYATPARYASNFLLSGYLPKGSEGTYRQGASVTVHSVGSGRVICFQDNPLFRGYWKTGERMFNNALFLSSIIEARTTESEK